MTGKADFTPQEWEQVLQAPPSAAMMVIMAQRGGTFRETFSIAKTYAEARQEHGQSELLDEIVATKPEIDRTRYHSTDELQEHALAHIRDAVAVLATKADEQELAGIQGLRREARGAGRPRPQRGRRRPDQPGRADGDLCHQRRARLSSSARGPAGAVRPSRASECPLTHRR